MFSLWLLQTGRAQVGKKWFGLVLIRAETFKRLLTTLSLHAMLLERSTDILRLTGEIFRTNFSIAVKVHHT